MVPGRPAEPLAGRPPGPPDARALGYSFDLPGPAAFPEGDVPIDAQVTIPVPARESPTVRFGRYELVSIIGSGGQGEVWLARHANLQGPCVIKFLRSAEAPGRPGQAPPPGAGAAETQRLLKEASRGFKVSHGNVARVMDCDQFERRWFLVMEFVDGADLASLQTQLGPLPVQQAIHIAIQFVSGLEAIHEAGLIHRDIKPANLLLTPRGTVKLTDLGVATLRQGFQTLSDMTTMTPMFVGTPHYAAPEQFTLTEPVDERADIYAAGVTLYQLITGRLPFDGASLAVLAQQHVHAPVPSLTARADPSGAAGPRGMDPGLLADLDQTLAAAMAKQRNGRPRTCAEFIEALRRCLPDARPASAGEAVPRGVAVMPFRNLHRNPADDWIAEGVAAEIEGALSRIAGLQVGDRHALQQRLRAAQPGGSADELNVPDDSLLTAARWIGVGTVVTGAYQRVGDQIRMHASVLRAPNQVERNVVRVAGRMDQLFELEDQVAAGVVQCLGFASVGRSPSTNGGTIAPRAEAGSRPANIEAYERFLRAQRAFQRGDYAAAQSLLAEALRLDADYADAISLQGNVHTRLGHYDDALSCYQRAEKLALAVGDEKELASVFANMGAMHYYTGQYERALDLLRQATQIESALDARSDMAKNRCNLGMVLLRLDRADEAAAAFKEAIEIHRESGDLVNLLPCYNGAGRCTLRLGQRDEALKHFERALALAEEIDSRVDAGMSRMNLANLHVQAGELDAAEGLYLGALANLERSGHLNGMMQVHEHLAELHLRRGRTDDAVRCIERRIALAQEQKNVSAEADAWEQMAKVLEKSGRAVEAMDALRNAYKTSRRPGTLRVADPVTLRPPKDPRGPAGA